MKFLRWICGALIWCSFFIEAQERVSLLIIDTQGKDAYYYRNLMMLARDVGFTVHYKNIYDLLEESAINNYQAVFFMISPAMLNMSLTQRFHNACYGLLPMHITQAVGTHCFNILRAFARQHHKAIGLILPGGIKYSPSLQNYAQQALYAFGQFQQLSSPIQSLINSFIAHITQSDGRIGSLFGTSLINPTTASKTQCLLPSYETAQTMPCNLPNYSDDIHYAFPLGLLIQDTHQHNTYLISSSSAFTFADVTEHLFRNPLYFSHRNELLQAAHETLQAFHDTYVQQKIPKAITTPGLPSFFSLTSLQRAKQHSMSEQKKQINTRLYGWMLATPISCAWLDPYDFFAHEDGEQYLRKLITTNEQKALSDDQLKKLVEQYALSRGIRLLYDGNFQLLWFECIPEWYLSPHGIRAAQKDEYICRMKQLGNALQTFFQRHNRPLPKIFVGLNLTSNFKSYRVANPVQSLSGTLYTKIPSPFDITNFWQPEVLDMFEEFVTTLKDHFPVDGVFFDFEMYHAQEQAGSYTDLMDFSDIAWNTYCHYTHNKAITHLNAKDRRIYLQEHKKFKGYFTVLQAASSAIGRAIKQRLRHTMPHLLFAAYAPTLPSCWFYRGIMAGLSSPTEPLILATFNTDYQTHRAWLNKQNIYVLHGTAIMLSKLQTTADFDIVTQQLTHHDFVWYNRPSRMIYGYDQDKLNKMWWAIEATSAPCKKIMHNIQAIHNPNNQY